MTADAHRYRLTITGTSPLATRAVRAFVDGRDGWSHNQTYTRPRDGITRMFVTVTDRLTPEQVATVIGLELPNQSISVGILEPVNLAEERDRQQIVSAQQQRFVRNSVIPQDRELRPA